MWEKNGVPEVSRSPWPSLFRPATQATDFGVFWALGDVR